MTPRNAAGISPEELSMQDAAIEGARAGHRGTAAALNPYDHGQPEHKAWDDARLQAIATSLAGSFC